MKRLENKMGITIGPGISIRSGINFTNVPNGSIGLNLNGTDQTDYVRFQPSAAYNLSSVFTVEGWFYKTAAGAREMMCANNGDGVTYYWGIRLQAGGSYAAWLGNGVQTNGTTVITLNAWHHVAAVGNGTNVQLYLDGVSQYVTPPTNAFPVATASLGYLDLGRNNQSAAYMFNGYINDVRITNGVALYTTNFTPPTQTLNVGAGTGFLAQTGYQTPFFESVSGVNGTGVGNAATSTLAPF
jgi:hypothetical protein